MTFDRLPTPGEASAAPRRDRGRAESPDSRNAGLPPHHQYMVALQRLVGNRAAQAAIPGTGRRTLQRLVLTTVGEPEPTDSPGEIAAKHEVALAARALAGKGGAISFIEKDSPPLDADKVNYVVGHSDGITIGGYDAEALADLLTRRGMKSGMAVRLVGCYTGTDDPEKTGRENQPPAGVARMVAIFLKTKYNLTDIAVKGALGELTKTKLKAAQGSGTSGVHTGVSHTYQKELALKQSDLMTILGGKLASVVRESDPDQFADICDGIGGVFRAVKTAPSTKIAHDKREEIAEQLERVLRKKFKPTAYLTVTAAAFELVMKAIFTIKETIKGDFKTSFDEATKRYIADCESIVETWLGNVGQSATRQKPGNITYKVGNPKFFQTSNTEDPSKLDTGQNPGY